MSVPSASHESDDERNNEPTINEQHENTEQSKKNGLPLVRFGFAKQANRSDPNSDTDAATQEINCGPPLGRIDRAGMRMRFLLGTAPDTALTMSQAAMGTMNYMAGVVFYMLTGEVQMGRFDPPSKRVRVDVRLDAVVLKALEREPARRYQQAIWRMRIGRFIPVLVQSKEPEVVFFPVFQAPCSIGSGPALMGKKPGGPPRSASTSGSTLAGTNT